MNPILQVEDLSRTFSNNGTAEFYAVDHIDFSLMRGEILGLVGESGSGKSTIAALITKMIEPASGTILLDGQDITHFSKKQMIPVYSRIQMVFQSPAGSFDPRRTLGDGITESLRNKGVSKAEREQKARVLLEQCGLSAEFMDRYPHEVSGGQCQRAAIARALMADPDILILDEATSALDVTVQKQIIDLLRDIQKEKGLSYLFICHNPALVQQFCDRVIVLYEGKIAEQGTPDEVLRNPKSEYAKRLVNSVF